MEIDILIEDDGWDKSALEALAAQACETTLDELGLEPQQYAVSILACGDERIATLNAEFRGKPAPTNVLSWPSEDRAPEVPGAVPAPPDAGDPELGDIAIAWETCEREAEAAGLALQAHVTHLVVHGVLHLLGYDHETDEDASLMERLEVEILASLGVADPY